MELRVTKAKLLRVEKALPEKNMSTQDLKTIKNTRRGLVDVSGKQYYFVANTSMKFPVVFGGTPEEMFEVLKALDNKMQECGVDRPFFKSAVKSAKEIMELKNVYCNNKTFIIKAPNNKYIGFMEGAAGTRAVCYRKGGQHYSCSVKSLIKDLDRPGKMSFRQMESQGIKIKEMITEFDNAIKKLNIIVKESNEEEKGISINKRERRVREKKVNNIEEHIEEEAKEENVETKRVRKERPQRRRKDPKIEAKKEVIRQKQMQARAETAMDDDDDKEGCF